MNSYPDSTGVPLPAEPLGGVNVFYLFSLEAIPYWQPQALLYVVGVSI
ncbi:MAG: hypothetical protein QF750_06130 [Prochlorococcaceae cyanobacterium ETNP14_MAG_5]|nr:hypothetical protein [Prochlorococcaceae cyanobacterium ETNP14_MAG_5]